MPSSAVIDFVSDSAPVLEVISTEELASATAGKSAEALVIGVQSADDGAQLLANPLPQDIAAWLQETLKPLGVRGGADEVVRVPAPKDFPVPVLVLTGVGSIADAPQGTPAPDTSASEEVSAEALRRASGAAVRHLAGVDTIVLGLPSDTPAQLAAVTEGATIAAYSFTAFRSSKEAVAEATESADNADAAHEPQSAGSLREPVSRIFVATSLASEQTDPVLHRSEVIGTAVRATRDFVNTPPSALYPQTLAESVEKLTAQLPITTTVWNEEDLAKEGFGGILSVGQGSSRAPRMVKLEYNPEEAVGHIALVGKGITFDTGGISLKPAASMMTMKSDMTGAATVASVLRAVAELELPLRVTGWLAVAENMPSGTAIRPSDVITTYGGKTVEVLNTDAEGRVVMADTLLAACKENPDAVVDIATLTGAQMVALGTRTTGIMGDEHVRGELSAAAAQAGESAWEMPIPDTLRSSLDSSVADLSNMGDRFGGMMTAAAFLREFVGSTPWAHLDIAGPSFNESGPWGYTPKDATGVMVRTLVKFLENRSTTA